jgi:hypothetical protein
MHEKEKSQKWRCSNNIDTVVVEGKSKPVLPSIQLLSLR